RERVALTSKRRRTVEARIVQAALDLLERHAELPMDQDLLQAQQILLVVEPVPGSRPRGRDEKSNLVIMVQRTHGDPGELRHLFDLVAAASCHASQSTASRCVRVKRLSRRDARPSLHPRVCMLTLRRATWVARRKGTPMMAWEELTRSLLHLVIAFVLGIPVGWDREHRNSGPGLRTYPLLAMGACAYLEIGQLAFSDNPEAQARTFQAVVSGIGFIGAGAIIKGRVEIHG